MTRLPGVPTWAEPVPVPVVVKYANAAPPRPRTRAVTNPMVSIFLFLNRFMLLLFNRWTADKGVGFPTGQTRPVDHHVAFARNQGVPPCCQEPMGPCLLPRALPWGRVLLVRTRRGGLQCPAWKNRNISFT